MSDAVAKTGNTAISKVDPRTGKVLTIRGPIESLKPPKKETISPISQVAGENPPIFSLSDHSADWNGMDLVTTDDETLFRFQDGIADDQGKKSEYVTFVAWVCPPGKQPEGKPMIIRTGAANVYARLMEAYVTGGLPIRGSLRFVPTRRGKYAVFLD